MTFTTGNIRQLSFSISLLIHLLLLVLFLFIKFTMNYPRSEYVELSFGDGGGVGSAGGGALTLEPPGPKAAAQEQESFAPAEVEEIKEVKLPEAKNTDKDNAIKPVDKKSDKSSSVAHDEVKGSETGTATVGGSGNNAEGEGGFGFDISWGGKGERKIYNYPLPDYPQGVEKEINIRLRFSIRPDGTVGTIMPLTKADTKLENAAINSLRQWRFEPLSPSQKQSEQIAVIVFPYRLQ